MQITFEGSSHQIDAKTMISTLTIYQQLIDIANSEYGDNRQINIKVNAIEKGSFILDIDVEVLDKVKDFFSAGNINYIANLLTVITGGFAIYQVCKGKKATQDITINNTTINVNSLHYYNNPTVRRMYKNIVQLSQQDEAIEGISLSVDKDKKVTIQREEFESCIEYDIEEEIKQFNYINKTVKMSVVSVNFEKGKSWIFYYQGNKISVSLEKDVLSEMADLRFGRGDVVEAEMEIKQEYDEIYKCYINKSYKIVRFINHKESAKQLSID